MTQIAREKTVKTYLQFLLTGLILGLFTEAELKLVAGVKPSAFVYALFAYPVLISLAYVGSRLLDRVVSSSWKADLLHYTGSGTGGLAIEWILLGNGPGSNAIQLGMVAMWTTFCFGPRVLTRNCPAIDKTVRRFWITFAIAAVVLTASVALAPNENAKVVIAVLALSLSYTVWSITMTYTPGMISRIGPVARITKRIAKLAQYCSRAYSFAAREAQR